MALYGNLSSSFALFLVPVVATDVFFFFFLINEHLLSSSDTACPCEGISGVSWSGHSASRLRKSAKNLAFHPLLRVRCLAKMEGYSSRHTSDNFVFSPLEFRGVNTSISAICSGVELRFIGICTRAWNPIRFDAISVKDECWTRDYYVWFVVSFFFFFFLE